MAPKELRNWVNDSRAAVFVLGVVFTIVLTGARTVLRAKQLTVDVPAQVQVNVKAIDSLRVGMHDTRADMATLSQKVDSAARSSALTWCVTKAQLQHRDALDCLGPAVPK